ncbi:DUF2281 domain-containing protein [Pricia sp.]|uniref:type II toxin-antitoxin system VapB family antitoxin n=1 Tax=Pricia sp. TaxID=2268138 RepID=UPI00359353F7
MSDIDIYIQISTLPDDLKKEVGNFVAFLKSKKSTKVTTKKQVKGGLAKGLIEMTDDFDDPLEDFKEYMP